MTRPKTKIELLDLGGNNYDALITKVTPLSTDMMTQAGACQHWSIKDILAHLHAWHKLYLTWYQEGMAGRKTMIPAPGYTWGTTSDLNASLHEMYRDIALAEIFSLLGASHQEVMKSCSPRNDMPGPDQPRLALIPFPRHPAIMIGQSS